MKKIIIFILTLFFTGVSFYIVNLNKPTEAKDYAAQEVIANLRLAIASAVEKGDYHCCINPPCTMCYLGSWIFKEGICRCDEMIANGEFDKVCPECKKGIEEGQCSSTAALGCDINKKNHD